MIQGILIKKAVELIAKQFKLDKVLSYVENDNELDYKVDGMEKRLALLEKMAHPKKDFVVCNKCKGKQCQEGSLSC
tara:strand:+ start:1414 stop:1641 length:228 start_codon:yes stop_codon:yes gene_type:complete